MKPIIVIEYCPKCGWLLRAAYFAQELLVTFSDDVKAVQLEPSQINGTFIVRIDGEEIFNRKTSGHFPETKKLKQLVRDRVNPDKSLGHSDR